MSRCALVTFFHQSSFAVRVDGTLLVFSYHEQGEDCLSAASRITESELKGFEHIVVFVPGAASEHCDPVVFSWNRALPLTYVVARSARHLCPQMSNVYVMEAGDHIGVADVSVRACGSADDGVSFLVNVGGVTVFHAGDLNLWHWREENSLKEIARAEKEFYQAVSEMPDEKIDLCMFPLDPNQGACYDAGANHFIMTRKPRVFLPMHFGARGDVARGYAAKPFSPHTNVYALTQTRQSLRLDFSMEPPLAVAFSGDGERISTAATGAPPRPGGMGDNPFSDSDLPVGFTGSPE